MILCCKALEEEPKIDRWLAEGFWYCSWFPKQEMAGHESVYYNAAITNFDHLAHWLFVGEAREDDQFEHLPDNEEDVL